MDTVIISKRCSKCNEIKPLSEFYKRLDRKNGYYSGCKACRRINQTRFYHSIKGNAAYNRYYNSKEGKMARKRYLQTEDVKLTRKRYAQSKKGRTAQKRYNQSRNGRTRHKNYRDSEKGKTKRKRYYLRHPDRRKAHCAVAKAIRIGQIPKASSVNCHYCSKHACQYHHWKGYKPKYWLDVIPVCIDCHNTSISLSKISC